MTSAPTVYATRDMVIHALDSTPTPRLNAAIDRALAAATILIEDAASGKCFHPLYETRAYDWPDLESYTGRALHLWHAPLTQATQITVGGTALTAGSYHLRPDDGPPYDTVLLDQDTMPGFWKTDPTTGIEDAVTITGLWGIGADKSFPAGTLAAAGITDSATALVLDAVTQPLRAAVGGILGIGTELVIVTDVAWKTLTAIVGVGGLPASLQNTILPISSTAGIAPGQYLSIDGEKLLVIDILTGTSLLVQRAQHGTVLTAHLAGAAVLAPWSLTVERGVLGTTAAAHAGASAVTAHPAPGLVEQTAVACAIAQVLDQVAGYAHPPGPSGGAQKASMTGAGAEYLLGRVEAEYGRHYRVGAI